jgi:TRAP-type uncharacterized transport system substrate-binding protein
MDIVKRIAMLAIAASLLTEPAVAGAQDTITWTGGVAGGGWDRIARGMAELVGQQTGLAIRVVHGGAAQNPVRIEKGDAQIGMGMPPLLSAAARGEDPYPGRPMESLRALAGNMSLNVFHFYVATDLALAGTTMEHIFRTRHPIRLAISRPGTADIWVLEKIMEYYGLCAPGKVADCYKNWETLGARFLRGSYADQTQVFVGRKVDAVFLNLALPAESVTRASAGRRLTLLAFPAPLLEHLTRFGVGRGIIPAGTYPGVANGDADVPSASMGTVITASARMADETAYRITRTINDNVDRVRRIHASLADYEPSEAHRQLGVPLHPGAERYYREKGWLR